MMSQASDHGALIRMARMGIAMNATAIVAMARTIGENFCFMIER
jgi:hypothetical protein